MPSKFSSTARKHIQGTLSTLQYIWRIDIHDFQGVVVGQKESKFYYTASGLHSLWPDTLEDPHACGQHYPGTTQLRPNYMTLGPGGAMCGMRKHSKDSALPFQVVISTLGPSVQYQDKDGIYASVIAAKEKPHAAMWNGDIPLSQPTSFTALQSLDFASSKRSSKDHLAPARVPPSVVICGGDISTLGS
ncbi:hypothetical protein P691DRAFT_782024 [Macrolepiota fuliginosa MF-IS2]|uniref:Uncharacterized protein n=1 Tax=Macrolepiota fuliginosa MF-IS2 TaxID=1400762 RepID=A0A9P5XAY5_9AGAR|nr:hypothetical protein P691DRAFT_782024 [Macrolepiota fuliginosa MF-IS2]